MRTVKTLLILLDSMIYYDREILKGIKAKLDESRLQVDVHLECPTNLDYILSRKWDYVIADYNKPNMAFIVGAVRCKTVVYTNHQLTVLPPHVSSVVLDNAGFAGTALQALLHAGINQVGYFATQQDASSSWSREREQAFLHGAQMNGATLVAQAEAAIAERRFPLGIYCSSDRAARRLATLCHDQKVRVPQDVTIIGTDSDDSERLLSPMPLSSVALSPFELGKFCMDVLEKVIRFKRPIHTQFSSYKLIHALTTQSEYLSDEVVVKAENYIRHHFHQNIKVKQVISFSGVSRKTLDTRFMLAYGMTVHQYMTHLRLTRVKHLLLNSSDKLDVIAKQCGYPGQSYLTQIFTKQYGVSPMQFRKASRPVCASH